MPSAVDVLDIGCLLCQHAMDERNGDRSFSHRRCHAFDVAASHIAGSEHAGKRGLEQIRSSLEWPPGGCQILLCKVRSGLDEVLLVERETAVQPTRICLGPGHQENVPDIVT